MSGRCRKHGCRGAPTGDAYHTDRVYYCCRLESVLVLSKVSPRPGGNITGFAIFEYAIGGKWLALLKDVSPRTTRVAVLRDPAVAAGPGPTRRDNNPQRLRLVC